MSHARISKTKFAQSLENEVCGSRNSFKKLEDEVKNILKDFAERLISVLFKRETLPAHGNVQLTLKVWVT